MPMKILIVFLLSVSLTANAWLLLRSVAAKSETMKPGPRMGASAAVTAKLASDEKSAALVRLLGASTALEPEKLRDDLRAIGVDDSSIRAVVEGILRSRFDQQAQAAALVRARGDWWRRAVPGAGGTPSQRPLVLEPLQALLGRDPFDVIDAEIRYDFLPADKRRLLAAIDLDYNELQTRASQAARNAPLRAEVEAQQLLARERRNDILAALTAEQRAEYELRFSTTAARNARRYDGMRVTEEEFRAIQPVVAPYLEQSRAIANGVRNPAYGELQQQTVDRLVAAVGYDLAVEYLWGDDSGPYSRAAAALREQGLPERQAARLLQLASDVGERAATIHHDASRTAEQKRVALLALREEARPRFEALAPPAVREKLPEETTEWLTLLGDGRYRRYEPFLVGGGWAMYPLATITAPPAGPRTSVPLPRRPGSN